MKSRSALVVSLHLDGFRRANGRGLVASHCRPWGSLRFWASHLRLADCSSRLLGEPRPSPQCEFPFGVCPRRQPVPRPRGPSAPSLLLFHAVSPGRLGCEHRAKDPARSRRLRPPGGELPSRSGRLRSPSNEASTPATVSCRSRAATASRLEWGCSGRLPSLHSHHRPPTLALARPYEGPGHRLGCSCLRRGWALLPCGTKTARNRSPAKPRSSLPLARQFRPGSGAFSTSPAPETVASLRSRLVLRDSLSLDALLRRRVPNPLRALRLGLDSLLPWVLCPLPRSSFPQLAPARAGASHRYEAAASPACAE